ncbi:histidine kinase [uncultured Shewanella sp.]|uniref:sensor histidine kinase n=1 Tax=uncultured Shewanella sp. TaxID=173975 RepID=UPI00260445F9|nr:histidine kinase [uncultured Shewanella sp.]
MMEDVASYSGIRSPVKAPLTLSQQFWTLQVAGWLGYALVVFFAIIRPQFEDVDFNLSGQLLNLMIETLSGFVFSYLQWLLIRRLIHLPLNISLSCSFMAAACLGGVYNIIKLSSYKMVVYHQAWNADWNMLEFGGWLLFSLTTLFVWTAIFFTLLYNNQLQKKHELLLRAQTAAKDAQLQMLRYQLNPHFMFNTMNAISTLILKNDNDKACEMLDKLCTFFRYTLDKNVQELTTLKKEMALLEAYLSIEKVRFGERLQLTFDIDENALQAQVPSMLLQPLVENAVKFAIEPRKGHGNIMINAKVEGHRLILKVLDDGKLNNNYVDRRDEDHHGMQSIEKIRGLGVGLSNTESRLNALFDEDFHIALSEPDNHCTCVSLNMPFRPLLL